MNLRQLVATPLDVFKKPWRGVTKIELFNKDTNEKIFEHTEENVANNKIPYYAYFNTVIKAKTSVNLTNQNNDILTPLSLLSSGPQYFAAFTYDNTYSVGPINTAYNPFAQLYLTMGTSNEDPDGDITGAVVGICDSNGTANNFNKTPLGDINNNESYYSADRYHFVWDYNSERLNTSFDAVWFVPSITYGETKTSSSPGWYSPITYQYPIISIDENNIPDSHDTSYQYFCYTNYINYPYKVVQMNNTSDYTKEFATEAVEIINMETGEIVQRKPMTNSLNNRGGIFYYDPTTQKAYSQFANAISPINGVQFLFNGSGGIFIYEWDLSGTFIPDPTLLTMDFNLQPSDVWLSSTTDGSVTPHIATTDTGVYLIYAVNSADNSSTWAIVIYQFNPNTPNTPTSITRRRLGSETLLNTFGKKFAIGNGYLFFVNRLYGVSYTGEDFNECIVINLSDGTIVTDKAVSNLSSSDNNLLAQVERNIRWSTSPNNATIGYLVDKRMYSKELYDILNGTLDPSEVLRGTNNQVFKIKKVQRGALPWSTCNKLSTTITKNSQTTLRITYDIIFDDIRDVVFKNLTLYGGTA